jgi:caspase domain-containing protein
VFLYYSGHGARVQVPGPSGQVFYREALVPCDADPERGEGLLFDHELNGLLAAIARRTTSVTVVLDCCHASGSFRGDMQARFMNGNWLPPLTADDQATRGAGSGAPTSIGHVDDCTIVTACQASELSYEAQGSRAVRHGLFTHALLDAVDAAPGDLHTLTWARIWQSIRAGQQARNPAQNPSIMGNLGRIVFGGPPVEGDPGLPVSRDEHEYQSEAGTLADVTPGTELAVYGELPGEFQAIDSTEDLQHRVGLLRVTSADNGVARALPAATRFALPAGARARIVRPGQAARLPYALIPPDPYLAEMLAPSPLLRLVPVDEAVVKLERQEDGRWIVTDAHHGTREPDAVLFALQAAELDCVKAVLEHYYAYSRPLRMAKRLGDLPKPLSLRVLDSPRSLAPAEAQTAASLSESRLGDNAAYQLQSGQRVCMRVENTSVHRFRVTLVNVAASGRVQMLGDEIVAAGATHIFWANSELGAPFVMSPPRDSPHCIDRMVAIGRTAIAHDLGYLRLDRSFVQVIQRTRDAEAQKDLEVYAAPVHWTSAQAVIETRR